MTNLKLTLPVIIERYKVADKFYCTFREYDISEYSLLNYDEAEEKLLNSIHKFCELEMWNNDLKVEFSINYK